MEITILVEPVLGAGFRAVSAEPLRAEAEAPTRDEAIARLRQLIQRRIEEGAEVVSLELARPAHPLAPFAGMFKDDPLLDSWKQAIEEYRSQRDSA